MSRHYTHIGFLNIILLPVSWLYALVVKLRYLLVKSKKLPCPVICVGNATMGGGGKTPFVRYLANYLRRRGYSPHIIMRGYKRRLRGTYRVTSEHSVYDCGDEALMLSVDNDVWVADDRVHAGEQALLAGADILLLDDGYQSPSLYKDIHFLVVDSFFVWGNGLVFPAGCLREFVRDSVSRADGVVVLSVEGEGSSRLLEFGDKFVIGADMRVLRGGLDLGCRRWVVFAGLARSEKFFASVRVLAGELGCEVLDCIGYGDHYFYSVGDREGLFSLADGLGACLVTSEKDSMRFSGVERERLLVVRGVVEVDEGVMDNFLNEKIKNL